MGTYSKKYKRKLSVLSVLTAAIFLLTGCGQSEETVYQIPEDKKLIVYTAHKEEVYEPIIKEFEERTGIFVELKAGDTIALFEELQQDPPGTFDVMFGGVFTALPGSGNRSDRRSLSGRGGCVYTIFCITYRFYIQQQAGIPGGCAKDLG